MKACAHASLIGAVVILAVLAACGGGGQAEPPPATAAGASEPAAAEPTPDPAKPAGDAPAEPSSPAPQGSDTAAAPAPADDGSGTDTRTPEVIAEVVKAHRKPARECYEKALKQLPDLKGDLVIHFTVKPDGKVKEAELNRERSTIVAPMVVSCVVDVIRGLEFPKSSRGMESTVNYPFNFNP